MKFYLQSGLLSLLLLMAACAKIDPEIKVTQTGQRFLDALYLGKVEVIRPMLDNTVAPDTDPEDVMSRALFINQVDGVIAAMQAEVTKKGFERVEIESVTFNQPKTQAKVMYKAYFKDQSTESDKLFFNDHNGLWLVDVMAKEPK